MSDNDKMNRLIRMLSERMGTPESELRSAVQSADFSRVLAGMDPAQAKQAQALLGNEQSAREFLSSPQAKAILKRLMS